MTNTMKKAELDPRSLDVAALALKPLIVDALDADAALTERELREDLDAVLARRRRRRGTAFAVAFPSALAVAAAALFAILRAGGADEGAVSPGAHAGEAMRIYIADSADPSSSIEIELTVHPTSVPRNVVEQGD